MHASSQKLVYADLPTLTSLNYAKPGESFSIALTTVLLNVQKSEAQAFVSGYVDYKCQGQSMS